MISIRQAFKERLSWLSYQAYYDARWTQVFHRTLRESHDCKFTLHNKLSG